MRGDNTIMPSTAARFLREHSDALRRERQRCARHLDDAVEPLWRKIVLDRHVSAARFCDAEKRDEELRLLVADNDDGRSVIGEGFGEVRRQCGRTVDQL